MAKTTEVIPNPLEDENKGVEQAAIKSVAGIPVHVTPPLPNVLSRKTTVLDDGVTVREDR